jgi:hypothetical protein
MKLVFSMKATKITKFTKNEIRDVRG